MRRVDRQPQQHDGQAEGPPRAVHVLCMGAVHEVHFERGATTGLSRTADIACLLCKLLFDGLDLLFRSRLVGGTPRKQPLSDNIVSQ